MNTATIIILIICATIIAIVAIIYDYKSESKMIPEHTNYTISKRIIKLHRNYIAGILSFAIIMLITAKYGGPNNNIFEYLSFGSTITSLVLSILAIFVTVQSSTDLYKQFAKIDNATDIINNASNKIDGTLSTLQEAENKLALTSNSISEKLETIVEQIDEKIKTRIKETEDNISKQLAQSQNTPTTDQKKPLMVDNDTDNDKKKYFLEITSANGLMALYACALSQEKNKPFELSQLFKDNEAYSFGFLIATLSAKFVQFTNDNRNNQITCTSIVYTSNEIYDAIKLRINQLNLGSDYIDRINLINNYFEISPLTLKIE